MLAINDIFSVITWQAAGVAALVLVLVEVLKGTSLVKSGDWARTATIVLSALLSGTDTSSPESVAFSAVVLAIATSSHELIEFIVLKYAEYKKNKAKK